MELPVPNADVPIVVCDVGMLAAGDARTVEALARLALEAHRLGCGLRIEHASAELCELIAFMGLENLLLPPVARDRR